MKLYIDNRQDVFEITEEIEEVIEKVILESLKQEGLDGDYEISLSFVNDEEIRQLNMEYRGIDKNTDVLSFPMEDEFGLGLPLLGDIIISINTAYRQAKDYKHSFKREIAYLVCHSMFHLFGYDHLKDDDKEKMRNKEKRVMENLKIFKGE